MADIAVNSDVSTFHVKPGVVKIGGGVVYYFFGDDTNKDFVYTKSLDDGETWASVVVLFSDTLDIVAGGTHWDQATPDDTGTLIHICVARDSANDFRYRTLDTADDSLGTDRLVIASAVVAGSDYRVAITKAANGNLDVIWVTETSQGFQRSIDAGVTWTARAALPRTIGGVGASFLDGNDKFFLHPAGWRDDDADVAAIFFDDLIGGGIDTAYLWEYDDDLDLWIETVIASYDPVLSFEALGASAIRQSDGHLIVAFRDGVTLTTRVFDVNGAASITELTAIVPASGDRVLLAAFVGTAPSDHIFVVHLRDTFTLAVYFRSTDGGTTWDSVVQFTDDLHANLFPGVTVAEAMPLGGRFAPIFIDSTPSPRLAFINLDNAVTIAAAGARRRSIGLGLIVRDDVD